jgi:hypothetical protein
LSSMSFLPLGGVATIVAYGVSVSDDVPSGS